LRNGGNLTNWRTKLGPSQKPAGFLTMLRWTSRRPRVDFDYPELEQASERREVQCLRENVTDFEVIFSEIKKVYRDEVYVRFRASMAHISQSRPDSGLGFQGKLKPFKLFPLRSEAEPKNGHALVRMLKTFLLEIGQGFWQPLYPHGRLRGFRCLKFMRVT